MNRRGQFSIIAALLVAVVLIGTVITTYAALRYSTSQDQPQVLSAIDETNLALEKVLGFTVGYYGSVLQVTGDAAYARNLTETYLKNSLNNIADIQPEWGASFSLKAPPDLSANWFTNNSYSAGHVEVKYDLAGLGIYGMSYNASCRLDVQVLNSSVSSKACLNVTKDGDEPLTNLGRENFKFYRYQPSNLTWNFEAPSGELMAFANGTYLIDFPFDIDSSSFVVQVTDARGIMVAAASFSRITASFMWNTITTLPAADYVDINTTDVDSSPNKGTQSNFTAQQYGPDGINDTLTESVFGTALLSYYPSSFNLIGSTLNVSGAIADLQSDNGVYMQFRSYASMNGSQSTFGDTTPGSFTTNTEDTIVGSLFTITQNGWADSISAYIGMTSSAKNMKCMIYKHSDSSLVGTTQQVNVSIGTDWVTFNFAQPKPFLSANTEYVLVAWSASGNGYANLYYESGSSNQGHTQYYTYGTPPNPASFYFHNNYRYAIYCNYTPPSEYTCEVEFTGTANMQNWTQLTWTLDSSASTSDVSVTYQLYNYQTGQYSTSGDGYMTDTIGISNSTKTQTITANSTYFRDGSGNWKLKFKAVKSTSTQFDMSIDLIRYSPESPDVPNYALDIEEQWTNVNCTYPRQDLCIMTGNLSLNENLAVDVRFVSSWVTVINSLQPNKWNNISVTPYISSQNFTIRFRGSNDISDPTQDSWNIDAVLLNPQPDVDALLKPLDHTIVVELLQNGTMRWLGQNLNMTTQAKPIPPVPVKAIHVNQTINGVNQEVPFQIEDWASEYRIPLALTNNATVFSNRQMIVFLVNVNVSKVTVWWDGRDTATQTPLAYTNRYFRYTKDNSTLSNGRLSIQFGSRGFNVTAWLGSTKVSNATFMRINAKEDDTPPELAYVIVTGTVRTIVQGEPEWSGGVTNCSNVYASVVYTLPANATYFTYQTRLIFVNSTDRPRTITDLCPIKLSTTLTLGAIQTENGTVNTSPIVASGTGTFINYSSGDAWTAHHWSQFNSTTGIGAGIMFTDSANQLLYAFDPNATAPAGSLNVSATAKTIEFSPVTQSLGQVSNFTTPSTYDITWHGAVATFNSTATPIYTLQGTAPSGLWLLVEYPPKITVTTES